MIGSPPHFCGQHLAEAGHYTIIAAMYERATLRISAFVAVLPPLCRCQYRVLRKKPVLHNHILHHYSRPFSSLGGASNSHSRSLSASPCFGGGRITTLLRNLQLRLPQELSLRVSLQRPVAQHYLVVSSRKHGLRRTSSALYQPCATCSV